MHGTDVVMGSSGSVGKSCGGAHAKSCAHFDAGTAGRSAHGGRSGGHRRSHRHRRGRRATEGVSVTPGGGSGLARTCHPEFANGWTGGGWCDGNGPDWTYRGVIRRTNGGTYFGTIRWAGDRGKSFALCQFSTAVWGGLYYFNNGLYVGSAIR
jgi:hypothetical protein